MHFGLPTYRCLFTSRLIEELKKLTSVLYFKKATPVDNIDVVLNFICLCRAKADDINYSISPPSTPGISTAA